GSRHNSPGPQCPEIGDHKLRAVGHHQRYAISSANAERLQTRSATVDMLKQARVGEVSIIIDQGGAARKLFGSRREHLWQSNLWILPVVVLGKEFTNSMAEGHLKAARCSRQKLINWRAFTLAPGFRTTKAFGVSPNLSCGTPTTATSPTAGCSAKACSNSLDE